MSLENKEPRARAVRFHPRHRRGARRGKEISAHPHALSAGAERLSAHRPRQKHLPELRHRARVRRRLQSAHGRHESDEGRRRVCGVHHRRRELAHRRLGGRQARLEAKRQNARNHQPATANAIFICRDCRTVAISNLKIRTAQCSNHFTPRDYFDQIYDYAEQLIEKGKAFVCDLSPADTDAYRGAPDRPGKDSPFRNRTSEENLDLFRRMKTGEFPDGARTLRAKIDMASPNIWLRDPLLYRIKHAEHHHTGAKWCIYPMYDFAHCLSDYIEGITHSICTLEFEVHRPLYDWILENLDLPRPLPKQYEFAQLDSELHHREQAQTDPARATKKSSPAGTIRACRRFPASVVAASRRKRCGILPINIGITKYNSLTDVAVCEHAIRDDLNKRALRRLAVLRPIKVVITNFPEGKVEELDAVNNPEDESAGKRKIPFSRELFIERDDFRKCRRRNFSGSNPAAKCG